ncbi:MAG: hypothetical protein KY466_15010 [Gemmatimonadetes bacterium]|nr:hypothetical protein [Gemmatimonadota bacterium]
MLEWLGSEGEKMRVAFTRVFRTRLRPFGSQSLQVGGFSDGRDGVQWNVAYDPRDGRQWVGVNLEGLQYDDWPVARLIERELRDMALPQVVQVHAPLRDVIVLWQRDYWQATARPEIDECDIPPTPEYRRRATQAVTLSGSGSQVEGEVSPHLMLRWMAPAFMEWEELFRKGKSVLPPVHEWANRRARKPVAF